MLRACLLLCALALQSCENWNQGLSLGFNYALESTNSSEATVSGPGAVVSGDIAESDMGEFRLGAAFRPPEPQKDWFESELGMAFSTRELGQTDESSFGLFGAIRFSPVIARIGKGATLRAVVQLPYGVHFARLEAKNTSPVDFTEDGYGTHIGIGTGLEVRAKGGTATRLTVDARRTLSRYTIDGIDVDIDSDDVMLGISFVATF